MGELSSEVLQSLGKYQQQPRIVPRVPRIPRGEPDSGISSARSTTTVPWGNHPEPELNPVPLPILELPQDNNGEAEHQF